MIAFLDFEASSLSKTSFPVEVAWVFEDGRFASLLIKPNDDWTDWSQKAEALHGLSRGLLRSEGVPAAQVARQMVDELSVHDLFASAPSWDGKWLSVLLRGGGLPRHALRLRKSDEAFLEVARGSWADAADDELQAMVSEIIRATEVRNSPAHRALPDARLELERWIRVRKAAAACQSGVSPPYDPSSSGQATH
jgi:hypothetical protein